MPRKFVQITGTGVSGIYALDNVGTIWRLTRDDSSLRDNDDKYHWVALPMLPEDTDWS